MFTNDFTRTFGIEHPIVCGGMTAVGTADLISAVANAGALGFLTALTQPTPEALVEEITRCRDLTGKPFGVNLTILPTINPVPYDEYCDAIIDSGITIVETAGGNPQPHLPSFEAAGVKVVHKSGLCPSRPQSRTSRSRRRQYRRIRMRRAPWRGRRSGAGPHRGCGQALSIPVIASGGIATGSGLVAALALGHPRSTWHPLHGDH